MLKKALFVTLLGVALLALVAWGPTPDNSLNGLACLEFCWDGFPCGQTGLNLDRTTWTFTTDDGGYGNYSFQWPTLTLDFLGGCLPLYQGNVSGFLPLTVTGTMACQDGSGMGGTFTAWRGSCTLTTAPIPSAGR